MNNNLLLLILFPPLTYGFPLAEERKKWETFFSHTAGSLGTGVRVGFRSCGLCKVSVFVLPSAIA